MEGENLDVHDVINDYKDFCLSLLILQFIVIFAFPISALLVIGPPTNAFLITTPHVNALPSHPLSTIDLTFVAIDDSFIIVDDEYVFHEVLLKSQFLEMDEKELDNVNKGGYRAKKH